MPTIKGNTCTLSIFVSNNRSLYDKWQMYPQQKYHDLVVSGVSVIFCFVLRLNVPVNNFSVMSGWSHLSWVLPALLGVKCLAQGHTTAEVSFEPPTSRF